MFEPVEPISSEPHDSMIDVINVYKKDLDRTLLRENLKLTVEERLRKAESFQASVTRWLGAGTPYGRRLQFVGKPGALDRIVQRLNEYGVKSIIIGGWATVMHGVARTHHDVDLVYSRTEKNIRQLAAALRDSQPYPRDAISGLPFRWDEATIQAGMNFELMTLLGPVDLIGSVAGGGTFEELLPFTQEATAVGDTCRVVTLERLIHLKRAAGRPKDLETVAELEALREERERMTS